MNNKVKPLYHILLFITILFNCGSQLFSQEKVNISAGIGIPEFIYMGLRFQHNQSQVGLSIGIIPVSPTPIFISGDFYNHFGGFAKFSDRRPWYTRIGLNYLRNEDDASIDNYFYLNLRIGRDFNISKKIGIEIDAGPGILLYKKIVGKDYSGNPDPEFSEIYNGGMPILPCFGIALFYRF